MTTTDVLEAPRVTAGQVWERGGRQYRVVYAGDSVNVRDVDSGRFLSFSDVRGFASTHRCIGNPMSEEQLLFRLSDLVRRSGVGDEEPLLEALERLVRKSQIERARK